MRSILQDGGAALRINEMTECFLLCLLKLNFDTCIERCYPCTRWLGFFRIFVKFYFLITYRVFSYKTFFLEQVT